MSIKLYLFYFLLVSSVIYSQSGIEEVIATVGIIEITESEFLERFELTPQFNI